MAVKNVSVELRPAKSIVWVSLQRNYNNFDILVILLEQLISTAYPPRSVPYCPGKGNLFITKPMACPLLIEEGKS